MKQVHRQKICSFNPVELSHVEPAKYCIISSGAILQCSIASIHMRNAQNSPPKKIEIIRLHIPREL